MPLIRAVVLSPVPGVFHYSMPEELAQAARPGSRLKLPFGRSSRQGFLVDFEGQDKPGLKEIQEVLPEELSVPPDLLELTSWAADYYFASWGEVLMAAVPSGIDRGRARKSVAPEDSDAPELSKPPAKEPEPTPEQRTAIHSVAEALRERKFQAFLLEGVTGSGKTEVYLQAAAETLRAGRQVLVLVPEIALSPQLEERFRARFPGRVAVLHSRQTDRARRLAWLRARRGEAAVVLGVRAGVFAPLPNLGLVVVDEEHEPSYKQLEGLRYHARDLAVKRAQIAGAVALLGSATPSLESRSNSLRGRYTALHMTCRVDARPMPDVRIVDMRDGAARVRSTILSEPLLDAMQERLERDEQIILFLNRRGYSSTLQCRACGEVVKCPRCDVSLTLHRNPAELRCHYCDYRTAEPSHCPACQSAEIKLAGAGTQRLETELGRLFSGVPLVRMDLDTTRARASHGKLLKQFADREARILLGTQMVAKGHDFPGVTLVGVVLADVQLYLPDFRASERTWQLLTQVAGRAGRGDQPGLVLVQSYFPEHPAVRAAAAGVAAPFAAAELEERQAFHFPPSVRMVSVRFTGKDEAEVRSFADSAAACAAAHVDALKVGRLGPAPMAIARVRQKFRYHLLLRSGDVRALRAVTQGLLEWEGTRRSAVRMEVDVDPVETL